MCGNIRFAIEGEPVAKVSLHHRGVATPIDDAGIVSLQGLPQDQRISLFHQCHMA